MNEELIYLEACLPEANVFRYFSIHYGSNLFDDLRRVSMVELAAGLVDEGKADNGERKVAPLFGI